MRWTSLEAAAFLLWARLALRKLALDEVRRQWGSSPEPSDRNPENWELRQALYLGQTTTRIANRLPFKTTCLVQSVALVAMLRRRNIPAHLRFGVRMDLENTHQVDAHSWVECGGNVILDSGDHRDYIPFK
jgi:hypothetical protein